MKIVLPITLLISILVICLCPDTGIKVEINKNLIKNAVKVVFLKSMKELAATKFPDETIDAIPFDIKLSNINLSLKESQSNDINVEFLDHNIISITAEASGKGKLDLLLKIIVIENPDHLTFKFSKLKVNLKLVLDEKKGTIEGKYVLDIKINKIDIKEFEIEFNVEGSILDKILKIGKDTIIKKLKESIKTKLREVCEKEIKDILKNDVYQKLGEDGLAINMSLLTRPKINENDIVLNFDGEIINIDPKQKKNRKKMKKLI
jgi:hypothetical protein